MIRARSIGWLLLGTLAFTQPAVLACTACFGKSDSNMARGMNMGIFALLLVIGTVLCGVAGFFVYLARRTHEIENAQHQTLSTNGTNV
jgi:hypothetical protein